MREKGIRHLPVVDGDRLVGVITDRDLRLATSALAPSPFPPGSRVSAVMSRAPLTADAADPVEDAARTMREKKIGCLPIVEDGRLIGIITGLDLLDALMRMTGVDKPSGRLEVRLPDHPGELARLTSFLSHRDLNVHSILTYPEGPDSVRTVLRDRLDRDPAARPGPAPRRVRGPLAAGEAMPSVIYHPAYRHYSFGDDHPFSPVRVDMMLDLLDALGLRVDTVEPPTRPRARTFSTCTRKTTCAAWRS